MHVWVRVRVQRQAHMQLCMWVCAPAIPFSLFSFFPFSLFPIFPFSHFPSSNSIFTSSHLPTLPPPIFPVLPLPFIPLNYFTFTLFPPFHVPLSRISQFPNPNPNPNHSPASLPSVTPQHHSPALLPSITPQLHSPASLPRGHSCLLAGSTTTLFPPRYVSLPSHEQQEAKGVCCSY